MSEEFNLKNVKNKIKDIKNIFDKLDGVINNQKSLLKSINFTFSTLSTSNYFSKIANAELLNQKVNIEENPAFQKLISSMHYYLNSKDLTSYVIELRNQFQNDVDNDFLKLNQVNNSFKWLFTSKKKKLEIEYSYKNLEDYLNSGIVEDCDLTINRINESTKLAVSIVKDDFDNNKDKYEALIKQVIESPDTKQKLPSILEFLNKNDKFEEEIKSVSNDADKIKLDIKESIDFFIANELLIQLKSIPIEEIAREKKGIRIKPLIEAGYSNIADIYTASTYNLSSVYGVSLDNAYTIKRVADGYAQEARKRIKIKLSYDDKNKYSSEVIRLIYVYRLVLKFELCIKELKSKYGDLILQILNELNEVGSGRFWLFYSESYKYKIKDDYNKLSNILNGDYGNTIYELSNNYKNSKTSQSLLTAWEDFKNNSIEFYNIIEEIYPDVLGNDDSLYNLPRDLAREIQNECFFPDGLLCTLRRYQEFGVKYILHQGKVLLGDEMGLGKTIQAIATMVSLRNTGATHFIVVCPASVITNWCREIYKHSKLKAFKVHGTSKSTIAKAWLKEGGVAVATYESVAAFNLDSMYRFSQLIVDEAHYIKNKSAIRTERILKLAKHAERVLFMTGTPIENKVDEMISLIEDLRPDIAQKANRISFMSTAPQFRKEIAPVYYRRKRDDVLTELPELTETNEWCDLNSEERNEYEKAILSKKFMESRRVSWNIDNLSKSSKMTRLKELVEEAKNDDRKVIVFSFFLDTISKIYEALGNRVCLNPINGSIPPKRRQEIIDEFEDAPAGTVLCSQIISGGTGLNIQAASVVIICEPQLKPSIENQAISRAYRMGQARNVLVYRLLCTNTIDERIINLLQEKQAIFDAFADKSEAAKTFEINDKTLGDIIDEEIKRINAEKSNKSSTLEDGDIVSVLEYEKAKDIL